MGSSIAPPSVLADGGAESLRFFTNGNAAFLRYYPSGSIPYAKTERACPRSGWKWSICRREGLRDVTLPVLTGRGLAVSRYSNAPEPRQRSRCMAHRPGTGESAARCPTVQPEPAGALRGSRPGDGIPALFRAPHGARCCAGSGPGPHNRHKRHLASSGSRRPCIEHSLIALPLRRSTRPRRRLAA